jgi:hypothetical protein
MDSSPHTTTGTAKASLLLEKAVELTLT